MTAALMQWVVGPDTGISSKALWSHMMAGSAPSEGFGNHPHDVDDFGRCHRLLSLAPHWFPRLGEMAVYGEEWRVLAEHWPELGRLYQSWWDVRNSPDKKVRYAAWHAFQDRITPLFDSVRVCVDCGKDGLRSYSKDAKGLHCGCVRAEVDS